MERYQVRPGDTAAKIAMRFTGDSGRWGDLRAANPARDWNRLYLGEFLWLPWARPPVSIGDTASALADARAKTPWLTDAFFLNTRGLAERYGMDPFELLGVFYQESGVHPSANPNKLTGANGLIHWMKGNIPRGITPDELARMNADEQLVLVGDWMEHWATKLGKPFSTPGLVYGTVFAPGLLGPSTTDDTVIFRRTTPEPTSAEERRKSTYWANESLDHGRKGFITYGDLSETIRDRMRESSFQKFAIRMRATGAQPGRPGASSGAGGALVAVAIGVGVAGAVAAAVAAGWVRT